MEYEYEVGPCPVLAFFFKRKAILDKLLNCFNSSFSNGECY